MTKAGIFDEIVNYRRSVRIYDEHNFDSEAVSRSLQRALLSPNSSNMQLWEFYRICTPEKKKKAAYYCLNQSTAITAQELIAVVVRPDLWKKRAAFNYNQIKEKLPDKKSLTGLSSLNYYSKLIPMLYYNDLIGIWGLCKKITQFFVGLRKPAVRQVAGNDIRIVVHKSAALAAQTFMLGMAAEGYDTCPMEGFDSKRMKQLLNLPRKAEITMIISCGKRKPEGVYGPRIRVPESEVIFRV